MVKIRPVGGRHEATSHGLIALFNSGPLKQARRAF